MNIRARVLAMTQEQWMGLLRQILPVLGTLAVSLGVLTPDQVGRGSAFILTIAGPMMIIASAVWSIIDKSDTSLIAKVDVIAKDPTSPVQGIVTANTPEGRDLAEKIEGNTTVQAGTQAAATLART